MWSVFDPVVVLVCSPLFKVHPLVSTAALAAPSNVAAVFSRRLSLLVDPPCAALVRCLSTSRAVLISFVRASFYCIILLTALFMSSCYWQPLSLTSTLSVPWSENVTTFADALRASLSNPDTPLPSAMPVVDRCWCDFSMGSVFEPFNVSNWERLSVENMKDELDEHRDDQPEESPDVSDSERSSPVSVDADVNPSLSISDAVMPPSVAPSGASLQSWLSISSLFTRESKLDVPAAAPPPSPTDPISTTDDINDSTIPSPTPSHDLPYLRRVYDLRPHGLDLVVDFGWS